MKVKEYKELDHFAEYHSSGIIKYGVIYNKIKITLAKINCENLDVTYYPRNLSEKLDIKKHSTVYIRKHPKIREKIDQDLIRLKTFKKLEYGN